MAGDGGDLVRDASGLCHARGGAMAQTVEMQITGEAEQCARGGKYGFEMALLPCVAVLPGAYHHGAALRRAQIEVPRVTAQIPAC